MTTERDANEPNQRHSVFAFLRTESFVEKASLLLVTAVLSGVIIPLVIKSTDEARAGRAAISRAREKLFDDVSEQKMAFERYSFEPSRTVMAGVRSRSA